ncbi:MAG: hypothetical protein OEV34_04335 [Gammaproteobacteria bacterium]|nr:hypothetical protein [Gammaproteobacteria bacterium]
MLRLTSDARSDTRKIDQINDAVTAFLNDRFSSGDGPMARLDRWTQQSIAVKNQAKRALVLEANDPTERCYANLIQEINLEAESGIYLATPVGNAARLQRLAGESGMSGRLFQHLVEIAPIVFPNELRMADGKCDLLWASIEARYDRATLDAEVSELILMHLMEMEDMAADMTDRLRFTFYAYHENRIRQLCALPPQLSDRASQHLAEVVSDLLERASSRGHRTSSTIGRTQIPRQET